MSDPHSGGDVAAEVQDPLLAAGTMVGDYSIDGKIGEGGMATVYAALHPIIGKRAAIKVMSARLCADVLAVERFVSEARAVNQIGHPNIVDVFAFGKLADGRSYLTMEWLQGETLAQRLTRERIPPQESVDILLQIADALEAAHAKNIIHRDLKPENIYLTQVHGGRRTLVKLLDFGIAKLTGNGEISQSKTKTGLFVGTPTHVSPEQARSKGVDARTDLYALGVTAYQMLLGRLPFDADNAIDLITLHLTSPPPSPRSLWPEIPPLAEALLLGLLSKSAEARPTLVDVMAWLNELRDSMRAGRPPTGSHRVEPLLGSSTPQPQPRAQTPPVGVPIRPSTGGHKIPAAVAATEPGVAVDVPALKAEAERAAADKQLENMPSLTGTRRKPVMIAAGIAGAVVLAVVVLLAVRPKPPTPVPVPVSQPAPPKVVAPEPAPAPPAPTPQPAPATIEATITVNVPATIAVDGKTVATDTEATTLTLSAGDIHNVAVTAPHKKPFETTIRAAAGEKLRVDAALRSVAGAAPPKVAPPPPKNPAKKSREYMLDPFGNQK